MTWSSVWWTERLHENRTGKQTQQRSRLQNEQKKVTSALCHPWTGWKRTHKSRPLTAELSKFKYGGRNFTREAKYTHRKISPDTLIFLGVSMPGPGLSKPTDTPAISPEPVRDRCWPVVNKEAVSQRSAIATWWECLGLANRPHRRRHLFPSRSLELRPWREGSFVLGSG